MREKTYQRTLTEGNPLTLMLLFAVPIFFGNLFQLFYGLVDTKIVGSILGEEALAAVGSVSTLYNLLTGFFNGMTLGFSVITARYFGAGNEKMLKRTVSGSLLLGYGTAVLIIFSILFGLKPLLFALHVPQIQFAQAYSYIRILVIGMFLTLAYNICANLLRAIGDSMTPLLFLVFSAVLNIGLDYLFILVFSMGVSGAAVATVLAQGISVVLCLLHIRRKFPVLRVKKEDFVLDAGLVTEMLKSGFSMGMMSSLVNIGTLILQTGINALGTTIIVAHTAARKVFEIWNLPVSVLGSTMATYSGQNYGAGKYNRIRTGLKAALGIGFCWSIVVFVLAHTVADRCIAFIASTEDTGILYWGSTYLRIDMSVLSVCVVIIILRNMMQGIGDYITPIVSSFIELVSKIVFTMIFVQKAGYWGVIFTEPVSWILMVIPLIFMTIKNPGLRRDKEKSKGK